MITQCWSNVTVTLKYGETKIGHNIRRINPYTCDTNVEDIATEKYVLRCQHIITSYILRYYIESLTQVI